MASSAQVMMVNDLLEERLQPLLDRVEFSQQSVSKVRRRSPLPKDRTQAARKMSAAALTSVSSVSDAFEAETLVHGVDSSLLSDSDDDDSCISSGGCEYPEEIILTPVSMDAPLTSASGSLKDALCVPQAFPETEEQTTLGRNKSLPLTRSPDAMESDDGSSAGNKKITRAIRRHSYSSHVPAGEITANAADMKEIGKLIRVMEGSCRILGSTINDILDVNVCCRFFWIFVVVSGCESSLAQWPLNSSHLLYLNCSLSCQTIMISFFLPLACSWTSPFRASAFRLLVQKIEAGKCELDLEVVDLPSTVEDCVRLFRQAAESKGLSLECSVEPDVPHDLMLDATRVQQYVGCEQACRWLVAWCTDRPVDNM